MASSVSCGAGPWYDGPVFNAAILRSQLIAASFLNTPDAGPAQVFGGALPSGGALLVGASSGMNVAVRTGFALCPSSAGSTDGGYLVGLTTGATLTIAGADPTNPRIDLVCATANDLGSSGSAGEIQVVTGTPAPSPAAPALPSNSIALAQVAVAAGASSIIAGNITDKRVFTAAIGGIVPVPSLSAVPAGYTGLYVHDRATGRLAHNPAAGYAQPKLLPFTPQLATRTTVTGSISAQITVLTVTVTTDGSTDIEIYAHWPSLHIASTTLLPGQAGAAMYLFIDGTQVAESAHYAQANNPTYPAAPGGGQIVHVTSSTGGDTPSAGTHTVTLQMLPAGDGTHQVQIPAAAGAPAQLYVKPVCL